MRNRAQLLAAALVGAVVASTMVLTWHRPLPSDTPTVQHGGESSAGTVDGTQSANEFRRRLAEVEQLARDALATRQVAVRESRPFDDSRAEEAETDQARMGDERVDPSEEERIGAHIDLIEEHLRAEPKNPEFERRTWGQVQEALASPELSGSTLDTLECGSGLCRVQIEHSTDEAAESFADAFFRRTRRDFPAAFAHREVGHHGALVSLVFLAGRGHEIPLPSAQQAARERLRKREGRP